MHQLHIPACVEPSKEQNPLMEVFCNSFWSKYQVGTITTVVRKEEQIALHPHTYGWCISTAGSQQPPPLLSNTLLDPQQRFEALHNCQRIARCMGCAGCFRTEVKVRPRLADLISLNISFHRSKQNHRLELMQTIKGLDLHSTGGCEPVSQLHLPPKSIIVLYSHEKAAEDTWGGGGQKARRPAGYLWTQR